VRNVGMIGLGLLGTAIAERLLRAGYEVVGFDLSDERRQALATAGGRAANSALAVAEACDVFVLSLPDSGIVAGVVAQIESALRPGLLIVDTTTGDPRDAETIGAELAGRGVRYLDATVAGSSAQVSDGQAIVMIGGEAEALAAAREILATFAADVFHVGTWGSGSRMKLVVNLILGLNRAALAEGITLARALGLEPQAALAVLRSSAAYSKVMDTKGQKMLAGDFSPQARLSQHLKDVRLILEAAERTGVELPLSLVHRELLERAEAAGFGEADNSAVIRAFDRRRDAT
jgi:3-hydroxyisobutyrate dehydrogenase-like beta-hydroxyacid dehydrogenase